MKWQFPNIIFNISNKICFFWNNDIQVKVVSYEDELLYLQVEIQAMNKTMFVAIVYAKCSTMERRILWSSLEDITYSHTKFPWLIIGDFNVISNEE